MWWRLVALWALCSVASGATVRLALAPAALVQGREVRLHDIASVESDDAVIRQRLEAARIAAAPLAGYTATWSRSTIAAMVLAQAGSPSVDLAWSGAQAVTVRRASRTVDGARLLDAARRQVDAAYASQFDTLELLPAGPVGDVLVPDGEVVVRPRAVGPIRAQTTVWIDLLADGAVYRSVAVALRAQGWRSVYVTRRAVAEGERLSGEDVAQERRDVLASPDATLTSLPASGAVRMREAVAAGRALLAKHIVAAGAVRQGDVVTLVLSAAGVRVETRAVAQQDAALGAPIRVMPAGGVAVMARVVDDHVVTIEGL